MIINAGEGGSITTNILENYCYQILQRIHLIEANPSKNPQFVNYFASSTDDETYTCEGQAEIPCRMLKNTDGQTVFQYLHPYIDTGFTPATGATIKGQNIVECAVSAFLSLAIAELDTDINVDRIRNITTFDHTILSDFQSVNYTALLTINFKLPIQVVPAAEATMIQGKAYL